MNTLDGSDNHLCLPIALNNSEILGENPDTFKIVPCVTRVTTETSSLKAPPTCRGHCPSCGPLADSIGYSATAGGGDPYEVRSQSATGQQGIIVNGKTYLFRD